MKKTWADKTYGLVCKCCGKRHIIISTPGTNLPKSSVLKCEEKK